MTLRICRRCRAVAQPGIVLLELLPGGESPAEYQCASDYQCGRRAERGAQRRRVNAAIEKVLNQELTSSAINALCELRARLGLREP